MALSESKTQIDHALTRNQDEGLSFENAFSGAVSFLRRRYMKDLNRVGCYWNSFWPAVTNRPNARFGPCAIRAACSLQPFDPPFGWDFGPMSLFKIVGYWDLAFFYADVVAFPNRLKQHIETIWRVNMATIALGGDHYITF